MKKFQRILVIGFSLLLAGAAVSIIVWISRDEHSRLTERETKALEQAKQAALAAEAAEANTAADNQRVESQADATKTLNDIGTLLVSLSDDDLPEE